MPSIKNPFKKVEIPRSGEILDYSERPEVAPPIPPEELKKAREAIREEISEQPSSESEHRGAQTQTPKTSQPPTSEVRSPTSEKSPALLRIEAILEQDLHEAFIKMDKTTQIRFKQEGERTARKIEQLLRQVKIKIKTILDAIRNWLKIIPQVNKFFIEQETKIKLDKIMALRKIDQK